MATIVAPERQAPPEPVVESKPILLENVSWKAYEALLESWAECHMRLTYDRGRLEIVSPLPIHERCGYLIGRLIELYTWEKGIQLHALGRTTFKLESKNRGLEPDECYWIQNEPRMRGRDDYDPETDPPMDLAIEIDITTSSLPRMSIYADLGALEIWRYKDGAVTIHLLRETGQYEQVAAGRALPQLTAEVLTRFINLRNQGDSAMLLAFARWLQEQDEGEKPASKPKRRRKK